MGFLGLFNFAFICFDLLAWPLFALGYPLCATIRAIETNSNYHMRKLVTYWILFSMISLVELAFVKLIERISLWPYIKLGTICLLVLPQFNGAHYCYKSLIQPYLSLNFEQVMKRLYKQQKVSVKKDNFLSVAEIYVSENGTEALEKLIARKGSRTGFGAEDIKAVAEVGQREMPSMVKGPGTGFSVEKTKAVAEAVKKEMPRMVKVNAVAETEKTQVPQMLKPKGNEFNIVHEDINKMEQPEIKSPVPENSGSRISFGVGCIKAVTEAEAKKRETLSMVKGPGTAFGVEETKAVAEAEKNEMPKLVKGSRTDLGVEKVKTVAQTEKSEIPPIVKSKGNEFKVDYKDVNKMEQPRQNAPVPENSVKPIDPILLQAKQKTIETVEVKEMTKPPVTPAVTEEALPAKTPLEKEQKEWTCAVCQVTTSCEANLNSHLTGMKHRTKCEELKSKSTKPPTKSKAGPSSPASKWAHDGQCSTKPDKVKKQIEKVQVKIKSEGGKKNADNNSRTGSTHLKLWCPYCSVTCRSETDYLSHLNGKKHLARVQEMAVYPAAVQQGWD